ncbi:KxYKxGKxW signal peptide domain-containing protein [Weissella koreensis]|uniref:KxYKxGKxW signal peptide domain-containing protein n=1 Tax=Weissella koreensis TaxID=165096 RepID=UPI001FAC10E2|nr:adhesive domain-containing protein [Weissella koreensis]
MKKTLENLVVGENRITRKKLYKSKKMWVASLMIGAIIGSSGAVGPINDILGFNNNISHSIEAAVVHGELFSDINTSNNSGTSAQSGLDPSQDNNVNFTISGGSAVDVSLLGDNKKYAVLGIPTELQGKVVANGPAQVTTNITVPLDKFALLKTNLDLIHTLVNEVNRLQGLYPGVHADLTGVNNALDAVETALNSTTGSYNTSIQDNGTYLSADIGTGSSEIIANNLVTALSQLETAVNNTTFTGGLSSGLANTALAVPKKLAIDALEVSKTGLKSGGDLFNQIANISLFGSTTVVMPVTIKTADNLDNGKVNTEKFVGTMANPNFITVDLFTNSSGSSNVFIGKEQVDDLTSEKQDAIEKITALPNLDDETKQGYIDQVNSAKTADEITGIVDAATAADKKILDDAKTNAVTEINDMNNLTAEEKQGYVDQVNGAKTVGEVNDILEKARNADQEVDDLTAEKKDAIEKITALPNLDDETKQGYIDQVNSAKTADEITGIVDAATAADKKILDDAKTNAVTEINDMNNLTAEEKQGYVDQVNGAKTVGEVNDILEKARNADQEVDDLTAENKDAIEKITALPNLDDETKQGYIDQVNSAKTADEITGIVDAATAADKKILDDAKTNAVTEINDMNNLTAEEKQGYVDQVNGAKTVGEVNDILEKARNADQEVDDLTAEKKDAIEKITALPNLDDETKQGYIDQVNSAKTADEITGIVDAATAADKKILDDAKTNAVTEINDMNNLTAEEKQGYVDQVNGAKTVGEVNDILEKARNADQEVDDLTAEKKDAIEKITALPNLDDETKQGYIDQVNSAKTADEITGIVDAATAADKKILDDAKTNAVTEINDMNNLTAEEKQGYVDQVNGAKTVGEVNDILEKARNADQEVDDLTAEKKDAIEKITALPNLDDETKQGYIDQVNSAKTADEITGIVDAATAADKKILDDAKTNAVTEINDMNNLTAEEKQGYVDQVNGAKTVGEVNDILEKARNADQEVDDLTAEKKDAIEKITALPNLDDETKQGYIDQVNSAKTADEITGIVDAATAADKKILDDAKTNAVTEINDMNNLTAEEKQGYVDQVNGAKTVGEVNDILEKARNADQEVDDLTAEKKDAIEKITALPNLDDETKQGYIDQVNSAKTADEITGIVDAATAADKKILDDAKTNAVTEINDMNNLTAEEKQGYVDQVNGAKTVGEVNDILEKARNADQEVDDLTAEKKDAIEKITALPNLDDETKQGYIDQVNSAKTADEITGIVDAATAADKKILDDAKTNAVTEINDMNNLTAEEKQGYVDQVNGAKTVGEVNDILEKARNADQEVDDLTAEKKDAIEKITALPNLDDETKQGYIDQVNSAKTADEITGIVDAATAADKKILDDAKTNAVTEINDMNNLTAEEKQGYVDQVNGAKTVGEVNDILEKARNADQEVDDLTAEKKDAIEKITALPNLDDETKQGYIDQVNSAKTADEITGIVDAATAADKKILDDAKTNAVTEINDMNNLTAEEKQGYVDQVNGAKTVGEVNDILEKARNADQEVDDLTAEKKDAIEKITALPNLDDETKQGYIDQVNSAKTADEITGIVDAATAADKKILDDAKTNAVTEINDMNNLTAEEKQGYVDQVNGAKTVGEVNDILEKARNADQEVDDLTAEKKDAIEKITALPNLDDETKQGYIDQVNSAKTADEITGIVDAATATDKKILDDAKTNAVTEINDMNNLTAEEKQGYVDQVNGAKTVGEVNDILEKARNADQEVDDLTAEKKDAIEKITALPNLDDETKQGYIDQVNSAKTADEITGIVDAATAADKKILDDAKTNAVTEINDMNNLTAEEKQGYVDQVNGAKTVGEVNDILEKARNADQEVDDLTAEKKDAIEKITALPNLDDETKQGYIDQVNSAKTADEITGIVDAATAADKKILDDAKTNAVTEINDMNNLTAEEKQGYVDQVNGAKTVGEVNDILEKARNADQEVDDLTAEKKDAIEKITALPNLDDETKQGYIDQVNSAKTADEITGIVDAATAADKKILDDAKTNAVTEINDMNNLTAEEKQGYVDQVNGAKTVGEVNDILEKARNADQEVDDLTAEKKDAIEKITALPNLDDETKQGYIDQVNSAKTADEITGIVDAATAADKKILDDAKTNAVTEINDMNNLTAEEKQGYVDQVNGAKTVGEVNDILEKARNADQEVDDLTAEKKDAIEKITALPNLDDETKQGYIDQVNSAKTADEITGIVDAATAADKKILDDAKTNAVTEINDMNNLTAEEKQGYIDQVNSAKTADEIAKIVDAAKAADEKAAADKLADDKKNAIEEINDLNNLDKDQKQDYIDQVNGAKTADEITKIVDAAKAADEKAAADKLADDKKNAIEEINDLNNLDKDQKQDYIDQVNGAKTADEITKIVDAAKAADEKAAADKLADDKKNAIEEINDLNNLDKDQKQDYIDQVNGAKTADEITKIVDAAKAADEKAAADKLADDKKNAIEEINDLNNLDKDQKQDYIDQVNGAKTADEITKIVDAAKAADEKAAADKLADDKKNAIEEINDLNNLDKDQKQDYIDQVNGAKTADEITKIVDAAKAADEKAAADKLADDKNNAIEEINDLNNLDKDQKQDYIDQVNGAKTADEITKIVDAAKAADEKAAADKLADDKKNAIEEINDLNNLDKDQKQDYIDQVNGAKTADEITKIVDAAKAADEKAAADKLADDKKNAIEEINDLNNLDKDQKQDYIDQVNGAKTADEITKIVDAAKAADEKAAADKLADDKKNAIEEINDLNNLDKDQKQDYIDQVNGAKTADEITKIVDAAKAADEKAAADKLADDKKNAIEEINDLNNLDKDQKQDYIDQVNGAKTADEITKIVDAAKAADEKAAADKLADDKNNAIEEINDLNNLDKDQKQDYIDQVNGAKTADEITKIVDAAKAADEKAATDKLADDKKNAIEEINDLNNLDKDQKQDYIDQVNGAKTADEITKIVDAAKAADEKAAADKLADDKKNAIEEINDLNNLDKDQKQDYIDQVNGAKTADEITKIVDAAKAADEKAAADKLADDKKNAIEEINDLNNLDKDQKQDYTNRINNAKTGADLDKVMQGVNLPQTEANNKLTMGVVVSIVLTSMLSLLYLLEKKRK